MAKVESFSLWLPDASAVLADASANPQGVAQLEARLQGQLPNCDRLIRWALVKTRMHTGKQSEILCQGAYLTRS
ncbi:MAG: hypothetical protein VKJ04_05490 [Vampirovibrionales bacterium]|nr:hypothetical protein [Vampirovibrionales bacterium]